MWHGYGMGGFGMLFGGLFWLVVIGLVIGLVVWLVRSSGGTTRASGHETDALGILKRRYARGEVSREEFEQMKRDLSS